MRRSAGFGPPVRAKADNYPCVWTDKVIIVTGGGNGIGRALCRRFAAEGAKAVVADVDGDGARQVATEIRGTAIEADVSREADVARLRETSKAQGGRLGATMSPLNRGAEACCIRAARTLPLGFGVRSRRIIFPPAANATSRLRLIRKPEHSEAKIGDFVPAVPK